VLAGVTWMLVNTGTVTVRTVESLWPLKLAEIVVVPGAWGLARPEASIVAVEELVEPQVVAAVTSCVLLSE